MRGVDLGDGELEDSHADIATRLAWARAERRALFPGLAIYRWKFAAFRALIVSRKAGSVAYLSRIRRWALTLCWRYRFGSALKR